MLTSDHFNTRTGDKDENYRLIVDEIIAELDNDKPNTMVAVRQMLDNLRNPESFYGLLVGEIQAGKTPAQMILIWLFARHPEFRGSVCFVTKNLDSIRRDIMSKFNSDLINRHIVAVCERHGINSTDAIRQFGLTYHIYTDRNTVKLGLAGQVEIILMQKDNFNHVRHWYSDLNQYARAAPILFLVDEMHEMYAGANDLVENNGLNDAKHIGNIGMLHWFQKKSQERRCYLIGVTATPYAPLSADPICWPTRVYQLKTDAPAKGLSYYGYKDHKLCPDIHLDTYNPTIEVDMEAISRIIRRPRNVLANGNTEVTFLCLTNMQFNEDHDATALLLKERFGDAVDVLVFNQKTNIPLSEWFRKEMLTKQVCASGAMIIIGRACMAAGITIKPATTLMAEHDGVTYQVTGITDQFMPNSSDLILSSTKQLMRILGWFPEGHAAHLWLPSDELHHVYRTEFGDVSRQFLQKYDPAIGSTSVNEITLTTKYLKKFYPDHAYFISQRHGAHLYNDRTHNEMLPEKAKELEIRYDDIQAELEAFGIDPERTIKSFGGNDYKTLRTALGFVKPGARQQIGYEEERYDQIFKAALQPKDDKHWQVNAFLWGPNKHLSKLKECKIVRFTDNWDTRDKGETATFKTPDGITHFIKSCKSMVHKYKAEFSRIQAAADPHPNSLSEEHHLILKMLDEIAKEAKAGRPLNAWSLFVKCHKIAHGTGSSTKCSEPYKLHKAQFTNICDKSDMTDKQKLKIGVQFLRV